MFRSVLVGVDGRQGGRDAIALAQQLAAPDARLTLAHIWGPFLGRAAAELSPLEQKKGREVLEREQALAAVKAQLVLRGEVPVGMGLHALAEETGADLLVVGSTRHALLGRVLVGDDCRAALDGAPCATAVATRGYAHVAHALQRLGVGYDDSPESDHALAVARELAALNDATIRACWVVSLQDVREERPIPADWPAAIDKLIDRHADRLAQLEGVHGTVTYGGPREELVQFGKALDLLIVGSRNYGPVERLFHGTVSRYLLAHATCPLLVLPRAPIPTPETSGAAETQRTGAIA